MSKHEIKVDLTEITLYYENGPIMQQGFYIADSKLHASWESYNSDGSKKCIASYNYGVKISIWTYWSGNKITKLTYDNNKIVNIEEFNANERIKNTP